MNVEKIMQMKKCEISIIIVIKVQEVNKVGQLGGRSFAKWLQSDATDKRWQPVQNVLVASFRERILFCDEREVGWHEGWISSNDKKQGTNNGLRAIHEYIDTDIKPTVGDVITNDPLWKEPYEYKVNFVELNLLDNEIRVVLDDLVVINVDAIKQME